MNRNVDDDEEKMMELFHREEIPTIKQLKLNTSRKKLTITSRHDGGDDDGWGEV